MYKVLLKNSEDREVVKVSAINTDLHLHLSGREFDPATDSHLKFTNEVKKEIKEETKEQVETELEQNEEEQRQIVMEMLKQQGIRFHPNSKLETLKAKLPTGE